MNISGMSNVNSFKSMQELQKKFMQLSAGQKINSAADDAAGSALSEKMKSLSNGYSAQSNNDRDAIGMYNVADGALSSINDDLNRLSEIGVKAGNGIYSDDDRALMQKEVDQIKESIGSQIKDTEFNNIKVLNNTSSNGLITVDTSLEKLGIDDFDVTKDFSLDSIQGAISKVSDARANLGAGSNTLEYKIDATDIDNHNTIAAMSRIADTDYGDASMNFSIQNVLNQYSFMAMQSNMDQYAMLTRV